MSNKKLAIFYFVLLILFFAGFFGFIPLSIASKEDLIISEIMYDPAGTDTGHTDWIELYNNSSSVIQLKKDSFGIFDEKDLKSGSDGIHYTTCHKLSSDISIDPHGFIILADNATEFKNDYPKVDAGAIIDTTFDLSSDDAIRLSFDKCATFFTEIAYDNSWGGRDGKTLEKIDPTSDNFKINWQESYISGGTPEYENFTGDDKEIEYSDQIRINELLPNPSGNEDVDEFIELYNFNSEPIDLEKWQLKDKGGKTYTFPKKIIGVKEYLPIYSLDTKISLNNSGGEDVSLLNPNSEVVSYINYTDANREDYSYSFEKDDAWQWTSFPTPGKENKFDKIPEPKIYSDQIIINELFPAPLKDSGLSEFVELFNGGDKDENLDGWLLKDRAGKKCDLSEETIESGGFLMVKGNKAKNCTLALNDTQGEVLGLYDPKDNLVSSASYDGSAKKGKSYSFDGETWRWSQYLTPDEDNLFNNLPIVSSKKENEIYVGVYAQFSAKASDKDKEKLKFTWDFGDGHKSYLQNTRHKYAKTGSYVATLKVSDGNEDVFKTFKIKVVKFPKIKLRIKEIMPNPKGLDTKEGSEYLVVKNESDKKINLKGWSIATGSKNLANHPITKDFKLKKGESKKLTRKYSKFSLVNTKGKIEIRYPNGKVAYTLKYEKDKIAEDEIYKKVDGKWAWIRPQIDAILALTATEIVQANPEETIIQQDIEVRPEDLGKQTLDESKIKNRIVLASYGAHLSLPDDLSSQPRVLGASTIQNDSDYFSFGRPYAPEPHWAVKFARFLGNELNQLLNNLINYF